MFFSGLLAKRNENTFQSISLKGMGWEEEGEQEAQRLQQSTDALFSSRQKALGIKVPSAHLTWATYFQVSGDPKCQQLNVCREGTQERETEGWREQRAPGSWQTLLMSIGAFGWSTLVVLALSSWLCPCAPFPRQGDMAQLPLLQERLISSLPQERKWVDLHFPTEAGRNVPPYIILCTQVCPRPACGLEQLWKHLYPSHLNALFRQTFLVAFKRDRLIFFHVFL